MYKKYQPANFFFASLNGLAAFFTQFAKRTKLLDEFLHCHLPHVCATRWNYASRLIHTGYQKLEELQLVFKTLLNNADEISSPVRSVVIMLMRSVVFTFYPSLKPPRYDILYNVYTQRYQICA